MTPQADNCFISTIYQHATVPEYMEVILPCEGEGAAGSDGTEVWWTWQYLSLSCCARVFSSMGELSRALTRAFQVWGGSVHFNQEVSISSKHSDIKRFSLRMHLRFSMEIPNCTPKEYHLSLTECNSRCRDFRSPWPTRVLKPKGVAR